MASSGACFYFFCSGTYSRECSVWAAHPLAVLPDLAVSVKASDSPLDFRFRASGPAITFRCCHGFFCFRPATFSAPILQKSQKLQELFSVRIPVLSKLGTWSIWIYLIPSAGSNGNLYAAVWLTKTPNLRGTRIVPGDFGVFRNRSASGTRYPPVENLLISAASHPDGPALPSLSSLRVTRPPMRPVSFAVRGSPAVLQHTVQKSPVHLQFHISVLRPV